jgi:hypothetical protein
MSKCKKIAAKGFDNLFKALVFMDNLIFSYFNDYSMFLLP